MTPSTWMARCRLANFSAIVRFVEQAMLHTVIGTSHRAPDAIHCQSSNMAFKKFTRRFWLDRLLLLLLAFLLLTYFFAYSSLVLLSFFFAHSAAIRPSKNLLKVTKLFSNFIVLIMRGFWNLSNLSKWFACLPFQNWQVFCAGSTATSRLIFELFELFERRSVRLSTF